MPARVDVNASQRPSGDHCGDDELTSGAVNRTGVPPLRSINQITLRVLPGASMACLGVRRT